jgi:hypothetical protein
MTHRSIELIHGLGSVELFVPTEMDTFQHWTDWSDYNCGDIKVYRFADSRYDLLIDSSYMKFENPDSIVQLSVTQPRHRGCYEEYPFVVDEELLERWVTLERINNQEVEIFSSRLQRINGRDFAVIALAHENEGKRAVNLIAATTIDCQPVHVGFTCFAVDCEGFIERMERSLSSVKIHLPD